jgi:hypothetical protein
VTVLRAEGALAVVFPDVRIGKRLVPEAQAGQPADRVQRAGHIFLL